MRELTYVICVNFNEITVRKRRPNYRRHPDRTGPSSTYLKYKAGYSEEPENLLV
jgi:hypothetical protein